MIPIQAPANTALYDLARIAQATGNMLVVERWQLVMRPRPDKPSTTRLVIGKHAD